MQNGFLNGLKKILADRHRRKIWMRVVSGLMAMVVFCTTYALILPGITLEHQTYCGLEEHTHTEECYSKAEDGGGLKKLICDPESEAEFVIHTHDDMCYNSNGELICPLEEREEHNHTDDCYQIEQVLTCEEEECEAHTHSDECYQITLGDLTCDDTSETHEHDDSCYEEVEELVCGMEETEGHTHDESCYTEEKTLVCSEVGVQEHKHDDSCYDGGVLACGLPEVIKHQHTDECFENINVVGAEPEELSCGKEEHTHGDECYQKSESESNSGGGGGGSSTEKTTAVDGTTEATTTDGTTETTTEGTTEAHEDLMFPYSDDNVTGVVKLPWSKELPDDLECEPVLLTSDEENYGQMLASIDTVVLEKEKRVENLFLYRLEWKAGEDTYILPDDITPSVQFTVINVTDESNKVRGLVLSETEEAKKIETEEALNTMIDKFSADTISGDVTDMSSWGEAEDVGIVAYSDEDTGEGEIENEFEAEFIPNNDDDYSVDADLTSTGIIAFAELSDTEYGSDGYYRRVMDLSEVDDSKQYLIIGQDGLLAMKWSNNKRSVELKTGYSPEGGGLPYAGIHMMYDYSGIPVEMQRVATSLDVDENNSEEYFRLVNPNDNDSAVTPNSETYADCFWTFKHYQDDVYVIAKAGTTAQINPSASNPFSSFNLKNAFAIYSDKTKFVPVYGVTITPFNPGSWQISARTYTKKLDEITGAEIVGEYTETTKTMYCYANGNRFMAIPDVYTKFDYNSPEAKSTEMLIYEYVNDSKNTVSDISAARNVQSGTVSTMSKEEREIPDCDRFVAVSGAKSIEDTFGSDHIIEGAEIKAKSDPASSQIEYELCMDDEETSDEDLYLKQQKNDGRVVSDKSVIYGDDDYEAIDDADYSKGDFSVALSALGQEYAVTENTEERTPLDVVFIYDLSGSMKLYENAQSTTTKWEASGDAISEAMKEVFEANEKNRVGVVAFSNYAMDVLPIGRYSADNDKIFTCTDNSKETGYETFQVADNLYDGYTTDSGERTLSQYRGMKLNQTGMFDATNTQWALQQAYDMFKKVDTKVYVQDKEISRQPVIVLVTDGDPTFCTYNYMNPRSGPYYGDGCSSGVEGYYTILSANYFKNLTSIHYNRQAYFYTIGMGIRASGYGTYYEEEEFSFDNSRQFATIPDNSYMRAILNPTQKNVEALDKYSDYWDKLAESTEDNGGTSASSNLKLAAQNTALYTKCMWKATGKTLKELLTGKDISGNAIDPGATVYHTMITVLQGSEEPLDYAEIIQRDVLGYTENRLPGALNPYADDYDYVDNAYFGNLTTEDLEDIFEEILETVQIQSRYDFLLKAGSNLVMTDPIGDGMEVKGEPVLRYFGKNYTVTDKQSGTAGDTTYTDYYWKEVVDRVEDSDAKEDDMTVDISSIVARVSTNSSGEQVVTLTVPENALPVFYPDLHRNFYYEELPVRLIFRVGLTEAAEQELKDTYEVDKNVDAVFYTNKYTDGVAGATVTFMPDDGNPYYSDWDEDKVYKKTQNTTDTAIYNFAEDYDSTSGVVTQLLGNNGKLELSKDNTVTINVNKVWENSELEHPDSITVDLFADTKKEYADGYTENAVLHIGSATLGEDNNWKYTWKKLPREEYDENKNCTYYYDVYYISERTTDGYVPVYTDGTSTDLIEEDVTVRYTYDDAVACGKNVETYDIMDAFSDDGEEVTEDENNEAVTPYEETTANQNNDVSDGEDAEITPMSAGMAQLYTNISESVVNATGGNVTITNITGYKLPDSGGSGKMVTFSAISIMIAALCMYILKRRSEMRKGKQTGE